MTPDDHDDAGRARRDPLDEDAAWQEIVAHYGDRAQIGPESPAAEPPEADEPRRDVFDRSYLDSQEQRSRELNSPASWGDEGHYVPPPPPPLPQVAPRRLAAWAGLFGAPAVMLIVIVLGWDFPTWTMGLLVAWFVGGFLYLVATMPRSRGDGWSGDDGAVV